MILQYCMVLFFSVEIGTCSSRDSLKPVGVKFFSINLINNLHWQPGNGSSNETLYYVQHKIYGDTDWKNKTECWGISATSCDLTAETADYAETYHGQVQARDLDVTSDWTGSSSFIPFDDTVIDRPKLKVTPKVNSLQINIAPFDKRRRTPSLRKVLEYLVTLSQPDNQIYTNEIISKNRTISISTLTPGTKYCITVKTQYCKTKAPTSCKTSKASEKYCATTKKDPVTMRIIQALIGGICGVVFVCVLKVFLIFIYRYTYRPKASLPASLVSISKKETLLDSKEHSVEASKSTEDRKMILTVEKNVYVSCPVNPRYVAQLQMKNHRTNTSHSAISNQLYHMLHHSPEYTAQHDSTGEQSDLRMTWVCSEGMLQPEYGNVQNEEDCREYGHVQTVENVSETQNMISPGQNTEYKNVGNSEQQPDYSNVGNPKKTLEYSNLE
ncbi:interleukin-20 receptor subunit alpha-like [Huso huso]|uniref:Interleukin-20 receptor subunit alpha-like n=1 Tax=Huso huso TaxID=61971 RepID=A0ABR0ZW98_HUSHU